MGVASTCGWYCPPRPSSGSAWRSASILRAVGDAKRAMYVSLGGADRDRLPRPDLHLRAASRHLRRRHRARHIALQPGARRASMARCASTTSVARPRSARTMSGATYRLIAHIAGSGGPDQPRRPDRQYLRAACVFAFRRRRDRRVRDHGPGDAGRVRRAVRALRLRRADHGPELWRPRLRSRQAQTLGNIASLVAGSLCRRRSRSCLWQAAPLVILAFDAKGETATLLTLLLPCQWGPLASSSARSSSPIPPVNNLDWPVMSAVFNWGQGDVRHHSVRGSRRRLRRSRRAATSA